MDMKKTGKFLAEKRTAAGLTQSELAEMLHVSDKAVSKWERGLSCPDVTLFRPLTSALHISLDEFLDGRDNLAGVRCITEAETPPAGRNRTDYAAEETVVFSGGAGSVSPLLFGSNLEHTRADIFRGLSAQMLNNRKFAGKPTLFHGCALGWFPIGEDAYFQEYEPYAKHCEHYAMTRALEGFAQSVLNFSDGKPAGIGQHEIEIFKDTAYEFRAVVKAPEEIRFTAALTSHDGKTVYAEKTLTVKPGDWQTLTGTLIPLADDADADLRLFFTRKGEVIFGALSLMPADNFRGMRPDVIEKLRELGVTVLRWPGGNFAGDYCWEDGLLPVDQRSAIESYLHLETQANTFGYDFHEIAVDDFILLCRKIGAEPFITINPVWGSPEDNARFVEYCNGSAATEYGKIRAERGFLQPFAVKLWSLGNEMGYGHMEGDKTPAGYSRIARANADAMLAVDPSITLCSSGPYPDEDWIRHSANTLADRVRLVSYHHYTFGPSYRDPAKICEEYYTAIEDLDGIERELRFMAERVDRTVKLSFDEWNVWYAWFHPSAVFNGIFTGLMMHRLIMLSEEIRLGLACHFEAINEGMIRVYGDHAELTAAGQIYRAMGEHRCGELLTASPFSLATRKGNTVTVTLINASFEQEKTFRLPVCSSGSGTLYRAERIKPLTRFEEIPITVGETVTLPKHSILLVKYPADAEEA